MSEVLEIKKQFIIEIDVISGDITYITQPGLSYTLVLGMMEYTKMMIMKEWLDET